MNLPDHDAPAPTFTEAPCLPTTALLQPEAARDRWFSDEVQVHESALRTYLRGVFPSVRDVDDVVQESYLRVWRARSTQSIQYARAFLFRVARHVAIDLLRNRRTKPVEFLGDLAELPVIDTGPGVAAQASRQEKIRLLGAAIARLPARCREIIILHKLEGLSQRDVAARLGLREKTVENQIAIGIKRCERYLQSQGLDSFCDDEA